MHTLVFDDGAGLVKAGLLSPHGALDAVTFPSLVVHAPRQLPRDFADQPGAMVVTNGIPTRFLVGQSARLQATDAAYDTSNGRYTAPDARIRFYGALGRLLPPNAEPVEARLVVGANVEAERALADTLAQFFAGEHRFAFNGSERAVTIVDTLVTSQPRGAMAYLRDHPPEALKARLHRQPLVRSTVVLVDIGNFTTDIVTFIPNDGDLDEWHLRSFSLDFGVQALREEVAALIREQRSSVMDAPLRDIDHALHTGVTTNAHGDEVSLADGLAEARQRLWEGVYYRQIKPRLKGVQAHYILVVGGGANDATYGPAIRQTWGHLPGFAIPPQPEHAVLRGYAVQARSRWGA